MEAAVAAAFVVKPFTRESLTGKPLSVLRDKSLTIESEQTPTSE
jgi:hypothetical protein